MSKDNKKQTKAQIEQEREQNNQIAYDEYVIRIESRQKAGEKIEVKSFENWLRKATDKEGTEILIAGDSGETGKEKFKRLAEKRMTKALDTLDLIQNLSSPQYESTEAEHIKIINALRLKVNDIEASFKSQIKEETRFSL